MLLQTHIDIPKAQYEIRPQHHLLFIGSCFADNIGQRFKDDAFQTMVNPYGVMYNPASVMHSVMRAIDSGLIQQRGADVALFTLGTNHVYILKETGEIVDNCQKRPQQLFREEVLPVDEIVDYLRQCVETLRFHRPDVQVVFTVSPIRYAKYGFHESQLSKASLLLAVDQLLRAQPPSSVSHLFYFPAYELVLDELRDYRFYKEDMLHPSAQAVEYLWQQLVEHYFSPSARRFLQEWKPIKAALSHRPFHPDSEEYRRFLADAQQKERELLSRYSH
jgi:hypothetical protein